MTPTIHLSTIRKPYHEPDQRLYCIRKDKLPYDIGPSYKYIDVRQTVLNNLVYLGVFAGIK